ncbi:MAG: hypothetical protein KJ065_09700 [Anaerolineae bacterium]|nr:hypothetical protein [Anaerolineae bacterium]
MAAFDQSITLAIPRHGAITTVRNVLLDAEQVISLREAPILIGFKGEWGYVFVAMADKPNVTQLRLMIDKAGKVRDAFRAHDARQALAVIIQTPRYNNAQLHADAAARLHAVRNGIARIDGNEPSAVAARPNMFSGRSLLRRLAD